LEDRLIYDYSVSTDFSNGVANNKFYQEIINSAIVVALNNITINPYYDGSEHPDVCRIIFKADLDAANEAYLDAIVAAHDGIELDVDTTFEKRLVKAVSSYSSEYLDYIPANGKVITFSEFGGTAPNDNNIKSEIIWDVSGTPELLFATHGPATQHSVKQITGNGTKILRLKIVNETSQTETCSVYFLAKEV